MNVQVLYFKVIMISIQLRVLLSLVLSRHSTLVKRLVKLHCQNVLGMMKFLATS